MLVNGRVVLKAGQPTLVDADTIMADARKSVQRMVRRLDMAPPGAWPRVA